MNYFNLELAQSGHPIQYFSCALNEKTLAEKEKHDEKWVDCKLIQVCGTKMHAEYDGGEVFVNDSRWFRMKPDVVVNDSSLYHQTIGRAYRPETKEKHLSVLASAYINSLSGHGIISGDNNIDVMEVLGLDKNNAVEHEYATKLLSNDLVPFIKQKWAQVQNLVFL